MRAPFRKRFLILQIEQMRGTKAITKIAMYNTDTTMFANYLLEQIQQTFVCGSHGWGRELERQIHAETIFTHAWGVVVFNAVCCLSLQRWTKCESNRHKRGNAFCYAQFQPA
jgi:hypothetical protein